MSVSLPIKLQPYPSSARQVWRPCLESARVGFFIVFSARRLLPSSFFLHCARAVAMQKPRVLFYHAHFFQASETFIYQQAVNPLIEPVLAGKHFSSPSGLSVEGFPQVRFKRTWWDGLVPRPCWCSSPTSLQTLQYYSPLMMVKNNQSFYSFRKTSHLNIFTSRAAESEVGICEELRDDWLSFWFFRVCAWRQES